MIRNIARGVTFGLGLFCLSSAGYTAEQVMKFQLVTRGLDVKTEKIAEIEGTAVSMGRYAGTAIFEDGRIANKEFTFSFDFNKGSGPFFGYSTYTFTDGSSLTMRFSGVATAGQPLAGDYNILSGTGSFAGATGTGNFVGVKDPWEKANFYKGSLNVTTP